MALCLDTHCHLDADEFGLDRDAVIHRAAQAGVSGVLLPAVRAKDHLSVKNLTHHCKIFLAHKVRQDFPGGEIVCNRKDQKGVFEGKL